MASNYNREWDRGKDNTWDDYGSWDGNSGRGGNHYGADEEYYPEGKRRRYNNGGYDAAQGYEDYSYDYGQGHSGGDNWNQDDRRGHYKKERLIPSEPSSHVIFLGLDPDFTESDLQAYLSSNSCSIETVTIIRDRNTGASKGFGFAQFTSIEHARAFVDPQFPFIQIPPPASHGASATAAFYKALESGIPHNGRRVKIDYSQSANPGDKRRPVNTNDGTRDIGNTQAPVLLFRGLDPLSGPQAIAQAMKYSSGFGKEGAKGMKRIVLIKDKVTMASWGFAFVEFVDIASASAVLAATMSPQIHPAGFRISDKPVAASFAHPYSFQPIPDHSLRDDACIMGSMTLGGVEGSWVRYWDEASIIAALEFKVEEPVQQNIVPTKEKKEKKKKVDADAQRPAEASALPVSDKPVTLSFKGGFGQKLALAGNSTSGPVKKTVPAPVAFSMADDDGNEGGEGEDQGPLGDLKATTVKKVAPMVASKKTVNNINKWNQVQEELRETTEAAAPLAPAVTATTPTVIPKKSATPTPVASAEDDFEYSDVAGVACLLCSRKFKALDQLKRHNKDSDLHKKNLLDVSLRELARDKAKAAAEKAQPQQTAEQTKYRDRASERRIMHNQPDIPLPDLSASTSSKRKADGPPPPPSPPPPALNPGEDSSNVGNKLLKMMGWKEGTGLGSEADGRIEPVTTAIYAAGVGLGASKGKEIGKYADGYSGYVQMAQDTARERYGS